MGRPSTGALTTGEALRIELSYLLKNGYIQKWDHIISGLRWTNGSSIQFESNLETSQPYIRLFYQNTNNYNGEVTNHDYKIELTSIPSNLGRGKILYFICPVTGNRARILYKCYGSLIWKSRKAYNKRIYYSSQQCSKLSYHNTRYWTLEKELERCMERSKKNHYQGNETRLRKRIKLLEEKKNYHDWARWVFLPKALLKGLSPTEVKLLQEGL